jgi:membrane protease YdiL (CAAX protease family)
MDVVVSDLSIEVGLLVLAAASVAAAVGARVLPPRSVNGPDRIPAARSSWLLLGVFFGAVGVYLLSMSLYFDLQHFLSGHAPVATTQPDSEMAVGDTAYLSTVPPLLAFFALLFGDFAVRDVVGQDLGLGRKRAAGGVVRGLVGAMIIIPPLFFLAQATEIVYRAIHYVHEAEHPLLKVLSERPGTGVMAAIIVGACMIAPFFEELLFRGHLQTLIRRGLYWLTGPPVPPPPPSGFPLLTAGSSFAEVMPFAQAISARGPSAWHTWLAIIITSAIFALVHPAWSRPIIFVLAVGLGYAYERTGNLWVSITMHAVFNSVNTVLFLYGMYAR